MEKILVLGRWRRGPWDKLICLTSWAESARFSKRASYSKQQVEDNQRRPQASISGFHIHAHALVHPRIHVCLHTWKHIPLTCTVERVTITIFHFFYCKSTWSILQSIVWNDFFILKENVISAWFPSAEMRWPHGNIFEIRHWWHCCKMRRGNVSKDSAVFSSFPHLHSPSVSLEQS